MTTGKIQYFKNTSEDLSKLISETNRFKKSILLHNGNSFILSNFSEPILRKYSIKGFIRCLNNRSLNLKDIKYIVIDEPLCIYNQGSGILYKVMLSVFYYLQEQRKTDIEIIAIKYNNSAYLGQQIYFERSDVTTIREMGRFFVEEKVTENYVNKRIVDFFKTREPSSFCKLVVVCPFRNSAIKNGKSLRNTLIKNFTQDKFEQSFEIFCLTEFNQNANRLFVSKSALTYNLIIFITFPILRSNVLNCNTFFQILNEDTFIDCVMVKSTKIFNTPNFTEFADYEWATINCLKYSHINIFTTNRSLLQYGYIYPSDVLDIARSTLHINSHVLIIQNIIVFIRSINNSIILKRQVKDVFISLFEEGDKILDDCFQNMQQLNIIKDKSGGRFECNNEAIFSIMLEKEEGLIYIRKITETFETEDLKLSYVKAGEIMTDLFSFYIKQIVGKLNKTIVKKISREIPKTGFLLLFELNFNTLLMSKLKPSPLWLNKSLLKLFEKIKTNIILSLKLLSFNGKIKSIRYGDNICIDVSQVEKIYGMFIYFAIKFVSSLNKKRNLFTQGISRFITTKRQDHLNIKHAYLSGPRLILDITGSSMNSIQGYLLFSIKQESGIFDKYYCYELSCCHKNITKEIQIQIENCEAKKNSEIKLVMVDFKGSILFDAEKKLETPTLSEFKKPKVKNKTEVIRNVLDFFHKYKYKKI